jgi:membrane fusion protein
LTQLFREEAIDYRSDRLSGEIILTQSLSSRWITALLALIIGAVLIWLTIGTYARTEIARGILVTTASVSKVYALRPGLVQALSVKDGDIVRAGQQLAIIESEQPSVSGSLYSAQSIAALSAQERLAVQQIGLSAQRGASNRDKLSASIDGSRRQRADVATQLGLQSQIVRSTQQTFEQLSEIVGKGFVSKFEYERRRQVYISAQQEESRLSQQLNALDAQLASARAEIGRSALDGQSEINQARSGVEQLHQQVSRVENEGHYVVKAPIAGRVTAIQTGAGRTVGGPVPMMTIVPNGSPLLAELYVPSRAIGFIRSGQEVRLLYDAFPYQRFGSFTGEIGAVSRVVISPGELDAPFKMDEPVYRVSVAPSAQSVTAFGDAVPLQPGMTLAANIILDRRSFWNWLMLPFNAVANRT